jgi:protein required for attachment to host cells
MNSILVLVADASRARLFVYRGHTPFDGLEELDGLVNPEAAMSDAEVFSESKSGTRSFPGGPSRTFDDHRSHHFLEHERRFAETAGDAVVRRFASEATRRLIVCASPKMLGLLRTSLERHHVHAEHELHKDVTHMTPSALQEHLAHAGCLPVKERKKTQPRAGSPSSETRQRLHQKSRRESAEGEG